MDEEKFGAIVGFNSNRRQLEKIKKDLEEKGSIKRADLKPIAGESEEVIGEKNKKLAERKETDEKQKKMEKEADKVFGGIFGSEEVREKLNDIVSDKTREKVLKSLKQLKGDIISYSKEKNWSSLGWKEGEMERAVKRISQERLGRVFKENKVSHKTIYNFLAEKVLKEKEKRKEQKEQPISKENKIFLDDLKNKVEKGVSEKLDEKEKINLSQEPAKEKEFVKLRRVTPLAREAIDAIREAFQKNENLKKEDIPNLLQSQKRRWEYLTPREQDLIMTNFEQLTEGKKDQGEKSYQKTKEKEIKETKTARRGQLAGDEAGRKSESSGKYYTGAGTPEDAREELIKLKNGKNPEKKEKQEEIPQKPERTKEDIKRAITAAVEVGDDETMKKLEKELEDFDKSPEQLFEEAQVLEAEGKAREAVDLTTAEKRQRKIDNIFPKEKRE